MDDFKIKSITLDSSGSVVAVKAENQESLSTKAFSENDWGIYKYRMDGLVGRLVKSKKINEEEAEYEILLSLKDKNNLPEPVELEEGEVKAEIIERSQMGGFSLIKFLGLSITKKYCLQYMEKDLKNIYMEDFHFDLPLAKRYFDSQPDDFNIDEYEVINGVVLQQITFKEYTSGETKIDASEIPVDATVMISGNFAYTSANTKYSVKYRVVPNLLAARAIKARADLS
jgi:hypothetical protein